MADPTLLYAWAAPGFFAGSPADHTWVTAYDNRTTLHKNIADVISAGSAFWFCWGMFRSKGGTPVNRTGFLGQAPGNLDFARCLVEPNVPSQASLAARGTIVRYGSDGVCHQLANQVLYATKIGSSGPLTVKEARWYMFSVLRYGTYGIPAAAKAFEQKIDSCGKALRRAREPTPEGGEMARLPDEFEIRARNVLGSQNRRLLAELLDLRSQVQSNDAASVSLSADALNAQNQRLFDEAARLLGPEKFEAIFGCPPFQKVNLVDPVMLERSRAQRATPRGPILRAGKVVGARAPAAAAMRTVTLKQLAASLAEQHELPRKQAEAMMGDMVELVAKHLGKGGRIRLAGLGVLQVRKRAARMGRNPATGEPIQIKASKKVAFRASKELKEAI